MSRHSQEAMEPLLLEEDLNNLLFTSLEFGSQTELTVVINHKKRDGEDEEKEKNTSRRPPPLSGVFFFSLTSPSGSQITHLVSERLSWCII